MKTILTILAAFFLSVTGCESCEPKCPAGFTLIPDKGMCVMDTKAGPEMVEPEWDCQ